MIVVDASVALKWVLDEEDSGSARLILGTEEELVAPDLLLAECAHILTKKVRTRQLEGSQARLGMETIRDCFGRFEPAAPLLEKALELSIGLRHSVYDCFYLALALSGSRLVTADRVFFEKCRPVHPGRVGLLERVAASLGPGRA